MKPKPICLRKSFLVSRKPTMLESAEKLSPVGSSLERSPVTHPNQFRNIARGAKALHTLKASAIPDPSKICNA
jgi:hypothetical protein